MLAIFRAMRMVLRQQKNDLFRVNKRSERFETRIFSIHAAGGGEAPGTCVHLDFSDGEKPYLGYKG